jgi:hypothetical protein
LDSFAGAVHELNNNNSHVVLVSRRIPGMIGERQKELADALEGRHPGRVTHVPVDAGLSKDTAAVEHTQRTRSFLLAAMSLVAAAMKGSDRIRFYENGVMSINLPISAQIVGARASRSTHPRSLMLLQDLSRLAGLSNVNIDNPFTWKTKVEVVRELKGSPEEAFIRRTMSCSRTREITRYKPHCGKCAQCLQRRIATLAADTSEADPTEAYDVDLLTGVRQAGDDRVMAVDIIRSALEFRRLSDAGFENRFAGELAWLTTSFPDQTPSEVASRFTDMFRRHGEAVRTIFVRATKDEAGALVDKTLPDSCLLRIVHDSPEMKLDDTPITRVRALEFETGGDHHGDGSAERTEIVIAIDDKTKQILIDGIAPIKGSSDFRIMSVLVHLYLEDRDAGRLPNAYRALSAEHLAAEASKTGDTAGRRGVSRLRSRIRDEFKALYGVELDLDGVIENVHGKGYRLNPSVRVVAPGELAQT